MLAFYGRLNSQPINYLNQPAPSQKAELFAKGIVSTEGYEHSGPAFSPDGKKVIWTRVDSNYHAYLLEMTFANSQWSKPASPSFFSADADDYYPFFSTDGKTLFFCSRRQLPSDTSRNDILRLWKVARIGNDWAVPTLVDPSLLLLGGNFGYSVSAKGNIYFAFPEKEGKMFDMAYAQKGSEGFENPKVFGSELNTKYYEDGPFVAPDESYLIFESDRPEGIEKNIDLYICFKKNDGDWSKPMNMGPLINTKFSERFAKVSPDGKYLFFGSTRGGGLFDIYWISASIIADLKKNFQVD